MDVVPFPTGSIPAGPPGLSDRLNRIPVITRTQKRLGIILAGLLLVDNADINAFAFAAPAIRAEWGLSVGEIGTITAASFLGMFVGSLVGGRLADRFGRRRLIVAATVFYSVFSLMSAFAVGPADLAVYRVLTGVGLQAMTVVVLTYVAEMFPRLHRGRAQTWILATSLLGIPAMAWFGRWVIPQGTSAWRWIFVLGAVGLVVGPLAARWLPESARWNESRGHAGRSEELVERIEAEARLAVAGDLPEPVVIPPVVHGRPGDLMSRAYRKRAIVLAVVMAFALSGYYGFNSWLPILLNDHGLSPAQSLTYVSILSLAAFPGALLALLFIDRVERRTAVLVLYTIVAALLLVFGFTDSDAVLLASGLVISLLLQSAASCVYTYLPEIFPTHLRALGAGFGNGVGRLSTFASTFLVAAILGALGYTAVFLYLAGAILTAGLVIGFLGERTRGRTLEEISGALDGAPDLTAARGVVSS